MAKKVGIVVTVLLMAVLAFFLYEEKKVSSQREEEYRKAEEQLVPLREEKRHLKMELESLTEDYNRQIQGVGSAVVLFTGLNEGVYTDIYPIMQERGYTGVLALSASQFPGAEGCMNQDQFHELLNAGWTICVKWEGVPENGGWLYQLTKQMEAAGIVRSDVMYFPSGTYAGEHDGLLQELGFRAAVHHGEEERSLIINQSEEGIWHPGAVGMKGEAPKYKLEQAVEEKGNLVFTVGYELEDEMYDKRAFTSMLDWFKTYEESEGFQVMSFAEARDYRSEIEAGAPTLTAAYEEQKAVMETKIQEVETKITELNEN